MRIKSKTAEMDRWIGARVRSARKAAGLTQTVLADALGISFQQVQKYELGKDRISVAAFLMIAKVLNVPIGTFLDPEAGPAEAENNLDLLTDENLRLLRPFVRIENASVRQKIIELVDVMVGIQRVESGPRKRGA